MNMDTTRNTLATLVAAALLVAPLAAHAQAAAPAAAPAATQPAAVPVTPETRAALKELFDIMNTRDNLTKTFQAMAQGLPPQMANAMGRQIEVANLTPEQKAKVRENMNQPFDATVKEAMAIISDPKVVDQTIDKMYAIYAKYYTAAEVKQIVAFYKTPVGAKTLTVMPQAINESLQAGVASFQARVAALMEKTIKTQVDAVSGAAPKK